MADKQISGLTAGGTLAGAEQVHALVSGNSRRFYIPAWQLAGAGHTSTGVWDQSVDGSQADVDFTGLAGAQDILVLAKAITKATTGRLICRVSVNNGSTFYSTSGDYVGVDNAGVETSFTTGGELHETNATAARSGVLQITGANVNGGIKLLENPLVTNNSRVVLFVASTSPINAVRIYGSGGGNLTGGVIYCFARGLATT